MIIHSYQLNKQKADWVILIYIITLNQSENLSVNTVTSLMKEKNLGHSIV